MANIMINNDILVKGNLSISRKLIKEPYLDQTGRERVKTYFSIEGILSTHLYFSEINNIKCPRYVLNDVEVYEEDMGSDDYNIIYHFSAGELIVEGTEIDGISYILNGDEMKAIEDVLYKNDTLLLGDIGEEAGKAYNELIANKEKKEEKEDE